MEKQVHIYRNPRLDPLRMGERIRKIRRESGMSQRNLAQSLGISQTLTGFYERGMRRVPIDILLALSEMGNVSLDWLVTGREHHKRAQGR